MAFGSSVAGRTRSSKRNSLAGPSSGAAGRNKGGAFPSKKEGKNPAGDRGRGKFPYFARDRREDDDDVIELGGSDSDSPINLPDFEEDSDDVGLSSGESDDDRVVVERDAETPERRSEGEGNDDTVIFIGSGSDDDESEERVSEADSGSEELDTSSENEAKGEDSGDEDFGLSGDQRSDESDNEEEEDGNEDERRERHNVEVDRQCVKQPGEPRTRERPRKEQNHADEGRSNSLPQCGGPSLSRELEQEGPHEVISIGSSDDGEWDDDLGVFAPLMTPGAVSSRTRSKVGWNMSKRGAKGPASLSRCECRSSERDYLASPARKKEQKRKKGLSRNKAKRSSGGFIHALKKQKTAASADFHMPEKSDGSDQNSSSTHGGATAAKLRKSSRGGTRESDFFQLLADSIWSKGGEIQEMVHGPQQVMQPLPGKFLRYDEKEHVEKTNSFDEMAHMWKMMERGLRADDIGSYSHRNEDEDEDRLDLDKSQAALCRRGKHDLFLDEEIGQRCLYCSYIKVEIKYYCPPFEPPSPETRYRSSYRDQGGPSLLNGLQVQAPENCAADCFGPTHSGTVWDLIPGVKDRMYKHQQEGFEFMWRNLAGSIVLDELKSNSSLDKQKDIGGCIISHAPGTGKTRLTLVFLQSYLELYPNSLPAIIVPASLLLTWADEFKKWEVEILLHNLNDELTGKEDKMALQMLDSHRPSRHLNSVRMVKLYSWSKSKSILILSYNLFGELIKGRSSNQGMEETRKILLELPGLVILDEGHTARNKNANLWNYLLRLKTKKRVILSGTPFQNNLKELYNTIYIVRPKISKLLPSRLKKFCQRGTAAQYDREHDEAIIHEIKDIMAPFVHLHKGGILQKNLPGLRDCLVVLNPSELQLEVLRSIQGHGNDPDAIRRKRGKNVFDFEGKQALVSVHPSLALRFNNLSPEEKTVISREEEKLRACELNPSEGVKTRFLVEFLRFCITMGEKVLIFSQYLDPLELIILQLASVCKWTKGTEVLMMFGKQPMPQRQSIMKLFNDPVSEARVLLASIKACSEGINLVGASRVILLDVVWNPSKERQAISRAYRLGQKRVVYTYHLIMKGTAEWEKYQRQAHKDRLSELVFSATTPNGDTTEKKSGIISDDEILDEMTSHPKLRDLFDRILHQPKEMDLVENFGRFIGSI